MYRSYFDYSIGHKLYFMFGILTAGILWDNDEVLKMGQRICSESCLDFQGIYAHDGHAYDKPATEVKEISSESVDRLTHVRERYMVLF